MLYHQPVQYLCRKQKKVCPLFCCYLTQPHSLTLLVCSRLFPLPDVILSHHMFEDAVFLPESPLPCGACLALLRPRVVMGLSWEAGPKEEGKERGPEQKGTCRARGQGKGL